MIVVRYPYVIGLAGLYDIDPLMVEHLSSFKSRAAKVVEFVGLLLGFIVVAVVDAEFDSYAGVFNYLTVGFFIALFCLFMSIFLGLYACRQRRNIRRHPTSRKVDTDRKNRQLTELKNIIIQANPLRDLGLTSRKINTS
jgi:hypothetical protein